MNDINTETSIQQKAAQALSEINKLDGEDNFHTVSEIDLMSERFRCEDGYFDYYEYINAIGNLYIED